MKFFEKIFSFFGNDRFAMWLFLLAWSLVALEAWRVLSGGLVPFWFDPARDLLLAKTNLSDFSLIGQPAGIPGLFYGPYWIWSLSLAQMLVPNPAMVIGLVQAIPFLVVGPWVFWQFGKILGKQNVVFLWAAFMINARNYLSYLWNPHPGILVFLVVCWLVVFGVRGKKVNSVLLGLCLGLLVQLHMSFGIGIGLASLVYLIIENMWIEKGRKFKSLFGRIGLMVGAVALTFLPMVVFEARHDFLQTRSVLRLIQGNSAVSIGSDGLDLVGILERLVVVFNETFMSFYQFPVLFVGLVMLVVGVVSFRVSTGNEVKKKFWWFLMSCLVVTLGLFVASPSPVWPYHFLGFEVIFLFLTGLALSRKRLEPLLVVGVLVLSGLSGQRTVRGFEENALLIPSLGAKQYVVETVLEDIGEEKVFVKPFSTSILVYDYDYLLGWLSRPYADLIVGNTTEADRVYLIVPSGAENQMEDYLEEVGLDKLEMIELLKLGEHTKVWKLNKL